jgi:hypothetical protein
VKPRYIVAVGERPPFAVAGDAESQRALFFLINQTYGLDMEIAAELLDKGHMIFGGELMVYREDALA